MHALFPNVVAAVQGRVCEDGGLSSNRSASCYLGLLMCLAVGSIMITNLSIHSHRSGGHHKKGIGLALE